MRVRVNGWFGVGIMMLFSMAGFAAPESDLRLVEAAERGDAAAVRALLGQKVDVNLSQADGTTALAWAVHRDDTETADLLIRAGANVNAANEYGVTPLSLACTNRNAALVSKLLDAGANPNAAQWTGETPVMACARTGSVEGVRALLARGVRQLVTTERGHVEAEIAEHVEGLVEPLVRVALVRERAYEDTALLEDLRLQRVAHSVDVRAIVLCVVQLLELGVELDERGADPRVERFDVLTHARSGS